MSIDPHEKPLTFAEAMLSPWPDAEENARLAWETAEEIDDLAAICREDVDTSHAASDVLAFVESTTGDQYPREFCLAFCFCVFCLRKTMPTMVH